MISFKQYLFENVEFGTFSGKKEPNIENLARVSHKFIYHSGTIDDLNHVKHVLEPQHGDWIKEIVAGAVDDHEDYLENHAVPLVWMSDKPNWVAMKVARKLKKYVNDVTEDDIKTHGHVAIIPRKGDHSEHVWKIGSQGLNDGPYTKITNLEGKEKKAGQTELYDHPKEPFGIERNEYVSAKPVEPMLHLTGQHLIDFLKHTGHLK